MRYAMTGATGFVGGALAARLRADGHDVVALVRDSGRADGLRELGVTLQSGDLGIAESLDELCRDVDGLYHAAGWYQLGSRDPEQGVRINVDGTRNVLVAARKAAVPRVVYTSTLAVNSDTHGSVVNEQYLFSGRHLSVYDETKARAHDLAEQFAADGLPVVTVMPGVVYGPGDTSQTGALLRQVIEGGRPTVPSVGGVCWGYVDDVAAGHVLAMQRGTPGESYMLAGPQASLATALKQAAEIAGTPGPITLPSGLVQATAAVASVVGRLIPLPPDYAAETLRASVATYYGDPTRAELELGWSCRSLKDGLRTLVESLGRPT